MVVGEFAFTDFYHQFMVIEADDLTERCKDIVDVKEDDCFALVSSYIAKDGLLEFNVLGIGNKWDDCHKGLDDNRMLGIFSIDEVVDKEAIMVDPTYRLIEKNADWVEATDSQFDEDIVKTRFDARLDHLRDIFYPDVVLAGIVINHMILEYDIRITGIRGPFLMGTIEEEPHQGLGIHIDDPVWALPYAIGDECRLFAMFAGEDLSEDEKKALDKIVKEMTKVGITFNGVSFRN